MHRYRIRAVDRSGKRISSVTSAVDVTTARHSLHERGWTVLSVKPVYGDQRLRRRLHKASNLEGGTLYRQLGELLAAGVPIKIALEEIQRLAPVGVLSVAWRRLSSTVNEGESFVHALNQSPGLLAPRHIASLSASQSQSDLAQGLIDIGKEIAWRAQMRKRWQQASAYPVFAILLLLLVSIFLITQVVPSLQTLLDPVAHELPWMTQRILALSSALTHANVSAGQWVFYIFLSFVILFFIIGLVSRLMIRNEAIVKSWLRCGFAERWVWPFSVAVHAHTLHVLLKQNVPLPKAVSLAASAAAWFGTKRVWEDVAQRVNQDGLFAESVVSTGVVPELYVALIRVGEEFGTLDHSLAMATEVFHDRYSQRLQRLDVIIGPALLVMAGSLIACIFVWILLPVYDVIALQGGTA